jgi:H+/Cl- antiporter ClcA
VATAAVGGALGGVTASAIVIGVTLVLKAMLAVVSGQELWLLIVLPLVGLVASELALYGVGLRAWGTFPAGLARSDLTGELVTYAGREDQFPWRVAPLQVAAIVATVGLGAPLGTEAPAAYLGVAVGAALGDRGGGRWRRLLEPAAVGGGSAGVAALMGIPLVGPAYILELGRRNRAPLSRERLTAGLVGGLIGWLMKEAVGVDLFRLVVPREPPHSLAQGLATVVQIGVLAGAITSLAGAAIHRAKAWYPHPARRLVLGGLVLAGTSLLIAFIASPVAAVGPGGGAISWVEGTEVAATTVLAVAVLRAVATTSAAAAGGCGGLFVPFMSIGDLAGRVFAVAFGVPSDLAGAAGAVGGIAAGYRLPLTAVTVALGQGGPRLATLTCLGTVLVATCAGKLVESALRLGKRALSRRGRGLGATEPSTAGPASGASRPS